MRPTYFERARMVFRLVREGRLEHASLVRAFMRVKRHEFVGRELESQAYTVDAFEIMDGQTITCPGFVAQMTSLLVIHPGSRVLDIGTGTGYQAAILAAAGCEVVSIEILESLHEFARTNLERAGFPNVELRLGDGGLGAPDRAPFDAIILACAPHEIPQALIDQLVPGGRLVAPVGDSSVLQTLIRIVKTPKGAEREEIRAAWFVPMTT